MNWATSAAALSPGRPAARRSGSNAAATPSMTPVAERRAKAISAARVMGTTRRSVGTAFLHPASTTPRLSARAAAGAGDGTEDGARPGPARNRRL